MPSPSGQRDKSSHESNSNTNLRLGDVVPHLQTTLFITGAFCVAWSWDLVVYATSHVLWDEDPLDNQIAFGNQHGTKHLAVLLAQYLSVCGAAASLSNRYRSRSRNANDGGGWNDAAIMAIEFFPSPIFAGKLMAYLSQYRLSPIHQALVNFAATWFAAFLAHWASSNVTDSNTTRFWPRTGLIIRDTLGFGLGIAWNVLLSSLGPEKDSQLNVMHFLALVTYLMLVLVIALKLAAMTPDHPTTLWERHLSMLCFAMYVVCGFTLVGFLTTLLGDGWAGSLYSFGIVLVLAAIMSTMVAVADLDGMLANAEEQGGYDVEGNSNLNSWEYKSSKFGDCGGILNCLIFVPCVWCCCPWVPLLILLAGMTESVSVKEHWFQLIAMVAGLASSIAASGMLTSATDTLAILLGICGRQRCYEPWMFVALQVVLAVVCTIILLPMIAPLAPSQQPRRPQEQQQSTTFNNSSGPPSSNQNEDSFLGASIYPPPVPAPSAPSAPPSEGQPLLHSLPPAIAPPPANNPTYDPYRM